MVIAVKYCGGCNPRYDRTSVVRQLRKDFPQVQVVGVGDGNIPLPDLVVVVCGCDSRCASHQSLQGTCGKIIMSAPEDYGMLYEAVRDCPRLTM